MRSIAEFDEKLRGTQFVSNWMQDLDIALSNASARRPEYHSQRRQWADEFLQRFGGHDSHLTETLRWALGEATWGSGERARAESLFETWLKEDPQWGWGWIAWSDLHWFPCHNSRPDHARAEELIRRGLAVPGVRDREELITRLADLYEQTGRSEQAAAVRKPATKARTTVAVVGENHLRLKTTFNFGAEGLPLEALPQTQRRSAPPSFRAHSAGVPAEGRPQRALSVRKRQEVQALLWALSQVGIRASFPRRPVRGAERSSPARLPRTL